MNLRFEHFVVVVQLKKKKDHWRTVWFGHDYWVGECVYTRVYGVSKGDVRILVLCFSQNAVNKLKESFTNPVTKEMFPYLRESTDILLLGLDNIIVPEWFTDVVRYVRFPVVNIFDKEGDVICRLILDGLCHDFDNPTGE